MTDRRSVLTGDGGIQSFSKELGNSPPERSHRQCPALLDRVIEHPFLFLSPKFVVCQVQIGAGDDGYRCATPLLPGPGVDEGAPHGEKDSTLV